MLLLCHQVGVPQGSVLGPNFGVFFLSLCGDCVHVCVCVLMCGP